MFVFNPLAELSSRHLFTIPCCHSVSTHAHVCVCVCVCVCVHVWTCYLPVNTCVCVCLVFFFFFYFAWQAWHHFLSSRPKVAKQLHFCRMSEKMLLRRLSHSPLVSCHNVCGGRARVCAHGCPCVCVCVCVCVDPGAIMLHKQVTGDTMWTLFCVMDFHDSQNR